uniref:Uncharacterized protein n=1 Tax=Aegilops tauschii TaxID=37682 RepID=M8AS12_AEGTA
MTLKEYLGRSFLSFAAQRNICHLFRSTRNQEYAWKVEHNVNTIWFHIMIIGEINKNINNVHATGAPRLHATDFHLLFWWPPAVQHQLKTEAGEMFAVYAYLLSDMFAVYALGQLSLHKSDVLGAGEMHRLSPFWTPFSIEDNELWLRHMLNLLAQVGLALYVFWMSSAHSQFLIPAIFVFVAGIIKYAQPVSDPSHICLCGWNHQVRGEAMGSQVSKPKCP